MISRITNLERFLLVIWSGIFCGASSVSHHQILPLLYQPKYLCYQCYVLGLCKMLFEGMFLQAKIEKCLKTNDLLRTFYLKELKLTFRKVNSKVTALVGTKAKAKI